MNRITKILLALTITFGGIQAVSAMTLSTIRGDDTGLGLGINSHDVDLLPASSVGASSSFLFTDLGTPQYQGAGITPDKWVFGTKTFYVPLLSIGTGQVINSIMLEISSGGHGLDSKSWMIANGSFFRQLSDGDGVGPRNPGNEPSPEYNALFLDTFDVSSIVSGREGGFLKITILPGGGAKDGWALDYARLVYDFSPLDEPVLVPGGETAPVPLPAAFWLFATGLLSLVRFKKQQA